MLRYQVQPATSADVAYLATLLEDQPASVDWPEKDPSHRLLEACAFSTQIWAARRLSDGSTSALWGVTPRLDNPEIGYLWISRTGAMLFFQLMTRRLRACVDGADVQQRR